ncbi:MAG: T9SS type B sorting domain-containing protein [Maribacter sp.]|nr:T9SS type B sorting domain-containing protein [Maribacter sp.]
MKKKITLLLAFSIIFPVLIFGQGETSNWYFGNNAGIRFNNNGTVTALDDGRLNTFEGCTTISDAFGDLLFYTEGIVVYDRNHNVMQNGTGLYGDPSSTQSAIIVPKPLDPDIFYIFTVDTTISPDDPDFGLNYSVVDITMNNGYGAITLKNINLLSNCSEKVAAVVKNCSDNSIWIVTLATQNGNDAGFMNTYHAFEINSSGVSPNAIKSTFPSLEIIDPRGYLKFSNDGTMMASANMSNGLQLFDFDPNTGIISNLQALQINGNNDKPYGIEFSPNNQFLYTHSTNLVDVAAVNASSLVQFDVSVPDIVGSQVELDNRTIYRGALQLGPNGKIYRTIAQNYFNGTPYLGVINNPNVKGIAADYEHNAIALGNNATQGLPPFIQSFFNNQDLIITDSGTSIGSLDICEGDPFTLQAEEIPGATYNWSKDGNSVLNPDGHIFQTEQATDIDSGRYSLEIILPDPLECPIYGNAQINVNSIPENPTLQLVQCDTDLNASLDGIAAFNFNEQILETGNTYLFYETVSDRDADNPIADVGNYRNTVPFNQTVYYTVINSGNCGNYGELELMVNPIDFNALTQFDLYSCENDILDDVLVGSFDLGNFATTNYQGESISFYKTRANLSAEQDPLPALIESGSGTIYARLGNPNQCQNIIAINLNVETAPKFELEESFLLCTDNPDLSIKGPDGFSTYAWYKKEVNSRTLVSNAQIVDITELGIYALEVGNISNYSDQILTCVTGKEFEVLPSNRAVINDVVIGDFSQNNRVSIEVTGDGSYEYSLDGITYSDSNNFENIDPGLFTAYVRDKQGCGVTQQTISVLGYPKFFTPNGDGVNDSWNLIGASKNLFGNSSISIFDRYGKKLAELKAHEVGWNGIYNAQPLPSADYWFKINLEDGRLIKGHFSLKR